MPFGKRRPPPPPPKTQPKKPEKQEKQEDKHMNGEHQDSQTQTKPTAQPAAQSASGPQPERAEGGSPAEKIADAIARASGFTDGNSPQWRNANPGGITVDVTEKAIGRDGAMMKYANLKDGVEASRKFVEGMLDGSQKPYTKDMTITQVSEHYHPEDPKGWAKKMASLLDCKIDTKLGDVH